MIATQPNQSGDGLTSLLPSGAAPKDRMDDALQAQAVVQQMILNDEQRSRKRALVRGLVDGNPPYKAQALKAAGRSEACNVNWRIAESFVNSAVGLFYDLFCEAPTYATIELDLEQEIGLDAVTKSRIVTDEFDRMQRYDKSFDYNVQLSQYDMVLYGSGPFVFEDELDWHCRAFQTKDLKVPDMAASDTGLWELAILLVDYQPDQLYKFIRNPEAARAIGWDVEATQQAIINACPKTQEGGQYLNWEWHQEQLKTASFYYTQISKIISVAHIYYKEFPDDGEVDGRISHKIVVQDVNAGANIANSDKTQGNFLFSKPKRYANWNEAIHPMYYDHGNGGKHYTVTGMGLKMYSAMEYQNRLMCKLADDAFAAKMLFKPTTATASQQMSLAQFGNYAVMPTGFDVIQQAINPMIQDGLMLNSEVTRMLSGNLSMYRQGLTEKTGNPITATESNIKAQEQAKLGKTQLNRYYAQLDCLFTEKYRRAINPKLTDSVAGGKEALQFQARCIARGVTPEEMQKVRCVKATRVSGQGSAYVRQQSLEFLLGILPMLPEEGRQNLLQDVIAARSGQFAVERYYPTSPESQKPTDQHAEAMQWVAAMKTGIMPIVTSTQNAVIYAQTFIQAGAMAVETLEQGADPASVVSFIDMCGQAAAAQLQRIASDPSRKQVYDALMDQLKQLASITDKLKQKLIADREAKAQEQAAQGPAQQGMASEMQMKQAKAAQDMKIKQEKADQSLAIKDKTTAQKMALNDATTAAKIANSAREPVGSE